MRLAMILAGAALAGCASPSAPEMPKKPEAPAMTAKVPEAPRAPETPRAPEPKPAIPAAPVDKTPIKVDLSKVAWKEPGELFGWDDGESRLFYYTNGTASFGVKIPADGEYQIVVTASSQPALNEHAKFKLEVDGQPVGAETACTAEEAKDYPFSAKLPAGERKISVSFTNDIYKENEYDRNFYLNGLKVVRVK